MYLRLYSSMNPLKSSPPTDFSWAPRGRGQRSLRVLRRVSRLAVRGEPGHTPYLVSPDDAGGPAIGTLLALAEESPETSAGGFVTRVGPSGRPRQPSLRVGPHSRDRAPVTLFVRGRLRSQVWGQTHLTNGRLPPTRRSHPVAPPARYARDPSLKALDCHLFDYAIR